MKKIYLGDLRWVDQQPKIKRDLFVFIEDILVEKGEEEGVDYLNSHPEFRAVLKKVRWGRAQLSEVFHFFEQKQKEKRWEHRLSQELDGLSEDSSVDKVAEVLWEHAILDRLAPRFPSEKRRRESKNKTLIDLDREDSSLYLKLFYSLQRFNQLREKGQTLSSDYLAGVFSVMGRIYPFLKTEENLNRLYDALTEKAEQGYHRCSAETMNLPVIRQGELYRFKGILVRADRLKDDGTIYCIPVDEKGGNDTGTLISRGFDFWASVDPRQLSVASEE